MLVAGSLPSRALGMTVFIVQHLATRKNLQSLFRPSAYFAFVDFGNFRNRHSHYNTTVPADGAFRFRFAVKRVELIEVS